MIIDQNLFQNIKDINGYDYDAYKVNNEDEKVFITADNLIYIIEDMICKIENLEEKYEDLLRDVEDNYKRISIEEQIDWNDRW